MTNMSPAVVRRPGLAALVVLAVAHGRAHGGAGGARAPARGAAARAPAGRLAV